MDGLLDQKIPEEMMMQPLCPIFGECGGCAYQHVTYAYELEIKRQKLAVLFMKELAVDSSRIEAVVPSPQPYYYRHRLDLTMRRYRQEGFVLGFQPAGRRNILPIDACVISQKNVSDYIPQLKEEAIKRWPEKYKNANVVVRTGDDGRIVWGGIGRRSLELPESQYLWTSIHGKKIFYSLDTFFQANLGILPVLMNHIESLVTFDAKTLFLDLYAGVGLFGVYFSDKAGDVVMVEDSFTSVKVMKFNASYHKMKASSVCEGKVETLLPQILIDRQGSRCVAMVDPPRKGLHASALETLSQAKSLSALLYLSCGPEALMRDLKVFLARGWKIERIIPFDFFPRTSHIETLVKLVP